MTKRLEDHSDHLVLLGQSRRTKFIGRFPGETSCLSLCWAVLDLTLAGAHGLGLTELEHHQLLQMKTERAAANPATTKVA